MPVIEPIPWDQLPAESRAMMEEGSASGMYTMTMPLQVIAYSSTALKAMHDQYLATFRRGVLEPRLVELLRIHSAQAGACEPCSASRKDDSISEDDVACLLDPDAERFTPRERAALRFFDLLATDHHRIDEAFYVELRDLFSIAEIIELGYLCSVQVGGHRFFHTLGLFSEGEPAIKFDPGEIDRTRADVAASTA